MAILLDYTIDLSNFSAGIDSESGGKKPQSELGFMRLGDVTLINVTLINVILIDKPLCVMNYVYAEVTDYF